MNLWAVIFYIFRGAWQRVGWGWLGYRWYQVVWRGEVDWVYGRGRHVGSASAGGARSLPSWAGAGRGGACKQHNHQDRRQARMLCLLVPVLRWVRRFKGRAPRNCVQANLGMAHFENMIANKMHQHKRDKSHGCCLVFKCLVLKLNTLRLA